MTINFEQVHNYYERLILEDVVRLSQRHPEFNENMLADVACLALNQLPARYVRHDVDLMFFLTEKDRQHIEHLIDAALQYAFGVVAARQNSDNRRY